MSAAHKIVALEKTLRDEIGAAESALGEAQTVLGRLLARREAGLEVADVEGARRTLAEATERLQDLRLIEAELPALLTETRTAAMAARPRRGAHERKADIKAYHDGLAALARTEFKRLAPAEILKRGRTVYVLARKAGLVATAREAFADLAEKPGGEVLRPLA